MSNLELSLGLMFTCLVLCWKMLLFLVFLGKKNLPRKIENNVPRSTTVWNAKFGNMFER